MVSLAAFGFDHLVDIFEPNNNYLISEAVMQVASSTENEQSKNTQKKNAELETNVFNSKLPRITSD